MAGSYRSTSTKECPFPHPSPSVVLPSLMRRLLANKNKQKKNPPKSHQVHGHYPYWYPECLKNGRTSSTPPPPHLDPVPEMPLAMDGNAFPFTLPNPNPGDQPHSTSHLRHLLRHTSMTPHPTPPPHPLTHPRALPLFPKSS